MNGVTANQVLAVVVAVLVAMVGYRLARNGRRIDPAVRAWLIIIVIFVLVIGWNVLRT
jgi:hypothetical protein